MKRILYHVFEVVRELKAWAEHARQVTEAMSVGKPPEQAVFEQLAAKLEAAFPGVEESYKERVEAGMPVNLPPAEDGQRCELRFQLPEGRIVLPEEYIGKLWPQLDRLLYELSSHDINPTWGERVNYPEEFALIRARFANIINHLKLEKKTPGTPWMCRPV